MWRKFKLFVMDKDYKNIFFIKLAAGLVMSYYAGHAIGEFIGNITK